MQEIQIRGTTGIGKTPLAKVLQHMATQGGLTVIVSDHYLGIGGHTVSQEDLDRVREKHLKSGADLSILCIQTRDKSLQVDFPKKSKQTVYNAFQAVIERPHDGI